MPLLTDRRSQLCALSATSLVLLLTVPCSNAVQPMWKTPVSQPHPASSVSRTQRSHSEVGREKDKVNDTSSASASNNQPPYYTRNEDFYIPNYVKPRLPSPGSQPRRPSVPFMSQPPFPPPSNPYHQQSAFFNPFSNARPMMSRFPQQFNPNQLMMNPYFWNIPPQSFPYWQGPASIPQQGLYGPTQTRQPVTRPAVNPDSYHGTFANSPSAKPITQYSSPETTTAAKPYEVPEPVTQAYPDYEHSTQSTTGQATPSYNNPQITESPKTTTQPEISTTTTSTSNSYNRDENTSTVANEPNKNLIVTFKQPSCNDKVCNLDSDKVSLYKPEKNSEGPTLLISKDARNIPPPSHPPKPPINSNLYQPLPIEVPPPVPADIYLPQGSSNRVFIPPQYFTPSLPGSPTPAPVRQFISFSPTARTLPYRPVAVDSYSNPRGHSPDTAVYTEESNPYIEKLPRRPPLRNGENSEAPSTTFQTVHPFEEGITTPSPLFNNADSNQQFSPTAQTVSPRTTPLSSSYQTTTSPYSVIPTRQTTTVRPRYSPNASPSIAPPIDYIQSTSTTNIPTTTTAAAAAPYDVEHAVSYPAHAITYPPSDIPASLPPVPSISPSFNPISPNSFHPANPYIPPTPPKNPPLNRVRGKPHVACLPEGIEFSIDTVFPFTGEVFAMDRKRIDSCHEKFTNVTHLTTILPFKECGVRNSGESANDERTQFHMQVIVSFEQTIGPNTIQSFMAQCAPQKILYTKQTVPKRLEEALEELRFIPSKIEQKAGLPTVEMRITVDKGHHEEGEEVVSADVGMPLVVSWRLIPESDAYGLLVRDCKAVDTVANLEHTLVDSHGCSKDVSLLSHPHYDTYHDVVTAHMMAFKVPDMNSLHINCDVLICSDIPSSATNQSSCAALPSPPYCASLVSSPANSILYDSERRLMRRRSGEAVVVAEGKGRSELLVRQALCIGDNCNTRIIEELDSDSASAESLFCVQTRWPLVISNISIFSLLISLSFNAAIRYYK